MNFITKFHQLSGKMRLAIFISALGLLFSVVPDWKEGRLFGGLVFGVIPLVIIWGFWLVTMHAHKAAKLTDRFSNGWSLGRREFFRLKYPPTKRPTLKFRENELEIIDISEKGLKLLIDKQIDLGRKIYGEAILLSGRSISVDGEVVWSGNTEVGLLMALIPSSIIDEERRVLSRNKY